MSLVAYASETNNQDGTRAMIGRGSCVCKHRCDVKMVCFPLANHAGTNLKKVFELKTRQNYFIYPFPRQLKLGKSLQT